MMLERMKSRRRGCLARALRDEGLSRDRVRRVLREYESSGLDAIARAFVPFGGDRRMYLEARAFAASLMADAEREYRAIRDLR